MEISKAVLSSRRITKTNRLLQPAALSVIVYIVLVFILPINKYSAHTYHLSGLEYRALLFAVVLPSIATWVAAFIGYLKLQQYVAIIRKSPEGADFALLNRGYAWLAWSLPIAAITNILLSGAVNAWPGLLKAAVILHNYTNLILPLVAFTIMGSATRAMVNRTKLGFTSASIRGIMFIFLTAGVIYCFLTFQQFDLSSLQSTDNPYFMPLWLMVLTIIIPSLYSWFIGLLAAYEIMLFSQRTEGVLYRSALRMLVAGLTLIIVSFVAVQFTTSVSPGIGRLVLGYRLVLTLIFRVIGGAGFILVALGANRLKTIEEI
jgi:hypothetical protein